MEKESPRENKFARVQLPWLIAAGAFVVYLLSLNHWVSFNSLAQVARLSGYNWQPELHTPVYWLLTYPVRWLPAAAIPMTLNLFAAIWATLTLALLARTVALLPHDRTYEQRQKEKSEFSLLSIPAAWMPPVLAVVVCGLQLTFWENATVGSSEMLDLLMFAYIIRCLLEFRMSEKPFWLTRAALVYGAAMTNNWAMIGFFPLFLTSLIWLKRLSFFSPRFLAQMALWGTFGLLLYLVLPLIASRNEFVHVSFWGGLKANLGGQKQVVGAVWQFFKNSNQETLLLCLISLVPLLFMSIRWASYFGDTSRLGIALTTLVFHLVAGVFLMVCIWAALDAPFSPRFSPLSKNTGFPFLTVSYIGALAVGYFSGYFLLLFRPDPERTRRMPFYVGLSNIVVTGIICALLVLTPVLLVYRNLPQIRITNGPMVKQFATMLEEGLPQSAVVLSDDSRRLQLVQALSAQNGRKKDHMFLDTGSLRWPEYHRFVKKNYPQRWQSAPPKDREKAFEALDLLQIFADLSVSNSIYYLHPSFGYYFEYFYQEPHGLVYRLNGYPTNALSAPPLPSELLSKNEAFWTKVETEALQPLVNIIGTAERRAKAGPIERLMESAHLKSEPNRDAVLLGALYSRELNCWGVELQRNGQLEKAGVRFARALDLNADNIVAHVNLECNKNLQAGRKTSVQLSKVITDEFGKYRGWDAVMSANGPFDEPMFCLQQGQVFLQTASYRQAAYEFERVKVLAPGNLPARLWLARLYLANQMADESLKELDEIRAQPTLLPVARTNQTQIVGVETSAHLIKQDPKGAEEAVHKSVEKFPAHADLLAAATESYMTYGYYTNALANIEEELKLAPDNLAALINKGLVCIQLGAFEQAIPPLNHALKIDTNNNSALIKRAYASLRCGKLDDAQRDYETLQKIYPTSFELYSELGDIAYKKQDTNSAIRLYGLYLANSPSNSPEAKAIIGRLKTLKAGSP